MTDIITVFQGLPGICPTCFTGYICFTGTSVTVDSNILKGIWWQGLSVLQVVPVLQVLFVLQGLFVLQEHLYYSGLKYFNMSLITGGTCITITGGTCITDATCITNAICITRATCITGSGCITRSICITETTVLAVD